jgi:hypothetical protein
LDGSLRCSANGTNVIRFRLIIKTDHSFNLNRLNSVTIDNLLTGQRDEIKNTGTEQSNGEVLGAFVEIIDLLYNAEDLYK